MAQNNINAVDDVHNILPKPADRVQRALRKIRFCAESPGRYLTS
jgi:hypothetical protein